MRDEHIDIVIITEDNDPQREYLIRDYCGTFEIVKYGDYYHEKMSELSSGFILALETLNIDYSVRRFHCDSMGEDDWAKVVKMYHGDVSSFCLELSDGEIIDLVEAN